MNTNNTIVGAIDPEVAQRLAESADEIGQGRSTSSFVSAGLAMASVPIALAALSKDAFGQTGTSVTDVLNFALMLEIFENEFYKAVLGQSSSAAQNAVFATVRAKVPASALPAIQQISKHEAAHVAYLQTAGASNILNLNADSFDFTGARGAGNGPFALAGSDLNFLLLTAQAAEDTGVRAYKGQAANLMSKPRRAGIGATHSFGRSAPRLEDPSVAPADGRHNREVQRNDHRRRSCGGRSG